MDLEANATPQEGPERSSCGNHDDIVIHISIFQLWNVFGIFKTIMPKYSSDPKISVQTLHYNVPLTRWIRGRPYIAGEMVIKSVMDV